MAYNNFLTPLRTETIIVILLCSIYEYNVVLSVIEIWRVTASRN